MSATVARYRYSCSSCGGSVTKPAVFTPKKGIDGEGKKAAAKAVGLHGWKCSNGCKSPFPIRRELRKKGDDV